MIKKVVFYSTIENYMLIFLVIPHNSQIFSDSVLIFAM